MSQPQSHRPSQLPKAIGDYRLVRFIGRGGMGEVCLAAKEGMTKPCALKVMLPEYSANADYRRRFLREAEILASLRHGRIVPVLDFGEADGYLYLAMEYIDGVDLRTLVQRLATDGRSLPVEIAAYIIGEIFTGLRHAHNRTINKLHRGVIHRDVTPQNVIISSEGEVLLTDFGIAHYGAEVSAEMFGTLQYIAPEQALGATCYRSDIYSACGVLHFMLSGQPPRPVVNVAEFQQQLFATPPSTGRSDVPEPLERLRIAGLQPDEKRRLSSAREALRVLESLPGFRKATTTLADIYEHYFGPPRSGMTDMLPMAAEVPRGWGSQPSAVAPATMSPAGSEEQPRVEADRGVPRRLKNQRGHSWQKTWWGDDDDDDDSQHIEQAATVRFVEPDAPRVFRRPHRRAQNALKDVHPESRRRAAPTEVLTVTSTEPMTTVTERVVTQDQEVPRPREAEPTEVTPVVSAEIRDQRGGRGHATVVLLLASAGTALAIAFSGLWSCDAPQPSEGVAVVGSTE